MGNNTQLGTAVCPARLSTSSNGAFMYSNNREFYSSQVGSFLPNNESIYWIPVNDVTAFTHPDSIKWSATTYPITFGRKVMAGYTVVGFVCKN